MACVAPVINRREAAEELLTSDKLGSKFHFLFDTSDDTYRKTKDKKKSKKHKKSKEKTLKQKRDKSPECGEKQIPNIELHGNPSSFAVYNAVRQAVLEHKIKEGSQIYVQANQAKHSDSESDEDSEERKENALKVPKIVGIGLRGVFELINESRHSHPVLCKRALQALLDMLQGQQPEGLKAEPAEVMDSLYKLLLDLATSGYRAREPSEGHNSLPNLACSCLMSLVIARGDTGNYLSAVAAMLMSPMVLTAQDVKIPHIITSLQKSVQAVLLGKTITPEWLTHGIKESARTDCIHVASLGSSKLDKLTGTAIASDGRHLYIHNTAGLFKVGTGYGGTIKGHVYSANLDFYPTVPGWLACAKGKLFFKSMSDSSPLVTLVSTEDLTEGKTFQIEGEGYGPHVMFSDGDYLGHVAAAKDDSFVVRTFSPVCNPMPLVSELPLKLARKCMDVFGTSQWDTQVQIHSISPGFDEDIMGVAAGKDFALIRLASGKMIYTGKCQSLGIKQGGPAAGKWAELPITKSPKISTFSVGHDGQHALLVAEDGAVFFVGTPKRGEDGDGSLYSKARRQPKPVKPKKMIKLEGKVISQCACNSGTSAMLTKQGEIYMFGKDTIHCDHTTGQVVELKDVTVQHVSLGKAHAVVLTNKGHVYSFGINNKGQCGREYMAGAAREKLETTKLIYGGDSSVRGDGGGRGFEVRADSTYTIPEHKACKNCWHSKVSTVVTMADEEVEEVIDDELMCPMGKHSWVSDKCMVCTSCGECTGYGNSCISIGRPDRNPGLPCGCGAGDSGCSVCGVCRACAGEGGGADGDSAAADKAEANMAEGGLLEMLAKARGENLPIDLFIAGRQGARNLDQLSRKLLEKKQAKAKLKSSKGRVKGAAAEAAAAAAASGSDYEQDHVKMSSLPPGKVDLGSCDIPATQIACGLQHTVALLENGEVYTFGSNQYGQLGQGDTNTRGGPCRVVVKSTIVQVMAGSYHTALLTSTGQVYTFGAYQKDQLGRPAPDEERVKNKKGGVWHAVPALIPGIGSKHGRRATWIGGSGDQTFLRIDESLINAHTLAGSNIVANPHCIGLIPMNESSSTIKSLIISRKDGTCKSFSSSEQASLFQQSLCFDPVYDVLWSYSPVKQQISCYNVVSAEARNLQKIKTNYCNIIDSELMVPVRHDTICSRSHTALHMLGCLDTLTTALQLAMTVYEEEKEKQHTAKVYSKDDFATVNRFESHGGGWGYSGHSIEAVRFMPDTDILMGGFGLFGGRGEYFGKIKLFELGPEGSDNEPDGELLAETEEIPYECGPREKYAMLFEEPIALQANHWYVAWARISGPSSDCGSSGQSTITTEDQVVFKFKSSKKSNNGTDLNAGQIPQLLYRLPSHDLTAIVRNSDHAEPAHILSPDFSKTVSIECFESLLKLLNWSWNTFCVAVVEVQGMKGTTLTAALLDLERLVYISTASLRLTRVYINEVYPVHGLSKKTPAESTKLAQCVGDVRALMRKILAQNKRQIISNHHAPSAAAASNHVRQQQQQHPEGNVFERLADKVLDECHDTFTACFHAFYPTGNLKWMCLCELLMLIEPSQHNVCGHGRLLSAVMEALCQPTVKLSSIMPINCEHETEQLLKRQYSTDDNKQQQQQGGSRGASGGDLFPLLVAHMTQRTEMEVPGIGNWSFKEILDKLMLIVILPVRQRLSGESAACQYSPLLISNTCSLLAAVIAELAASATGADADVVAGAPGVGGRRPLLVTPNRFTRTSTGAHWNTGNGSPDATGFSVDRSGIVIAGATVYGGGGGTYEYELELLDYSEGGGESNNTHNGRWENTLETVKGTFGPDDCVNDIAEIKFDKPVPIKEGVKYAMRIKNRGPRTLNGDGGMNTVKCPDGTTITFCACPLSTNGTNNTRGQLPQILYYSAPQDGENHVQTSKALAEYQARKNAIMVSSSIFRAATDLLNRAHGLPEEVLCRVFGSAHIFSTLLPLVAAYIGPVAALDPRGAVQVLGLVQEVLPPIAQLNSQLSKSAATSPVLSPTDTHSLIEGNTTTQHYAIVESDHPYKPATVANYKVTFPEAVKWMVLEFDPLCGTAQVEDTLQLYIPAKRAPHGFHWTHLEEANKNEPDKAWWPVLTKFSGTSNWPNMAVVLPGNEMWFSLETASDYVKDDKAPTYGFKCVVLGYEWSSSQPQEGLARLEKEVACLGGMCAAALMRKDIPLPPTCIEENDDDYESQDEGAQAVFQAHSELLNKGFALCQPPNISQALEGNLPFSWNSNERTFLKDFVNCNPGTSGGRLAAWLQPESYLDPKQCTVYNKEELRCSWPATIIVQTKDQYGSLVNVPNLKVEAKAIPIIKDTMERKKRMSHYDRDTTLLFGGHPPPCLDMPYQVSFKDRKDAYHAICMMKAYENYSFEELRFATPTVRRPKENMLVQRNNDGTYHCHWTPGSVGHYNIHVLLDGYMTAGLLKVEVKDPPQGVVPPSQEDKAKVQGHQPSRMRKFVAPWSAGLRIRLSPSLQSEQVGIIKPNGIISFIYEIHNDDGVWLRLSPESIQKCCPANAGGEILEAWALQYNQHLGKTLLVPVEEPKSLLDEIIKGSMSRRPPMRPGGGGEEGVARAQKGGPGVYTVVKCGSSGHNIRCRPSLKATPIGMMILGNQATAVTDVNNSEGSWIKLDADSSAHYCHDQEGEAWSLARDTDSIVYLQHEQAAGTADLDATPSPDSFNLASTSKGFDFTTAQQTPLFAVFGGNGPEAEQVPAAFSSPNGPVTSPTFGQGPWGATPSNTPQPSPSWPTFGAKYLEPGSLPKPPERKDSLASKDISRDIPPELQGVSVKDLVKALGKVRMERELSKIMRRKPDSSSPSSSPRSSDKSSTSVNLENALKGVPVKDLIRLLGESRVNGNGATPPRTPPGTPKKTASPRSGSPRTSSPGGLQAPSSPQSPRRDPLTLGLAGSSGHGAAQSPPRTPSRTPPMPRRSGLPQHHRRLSEGGTPPLSRRLVDPHSPPLTPPSRRKENPTPPATPPSIRKDSQSSTPRFISPARSPTARSSSSSPQRSCSPMSLPMRASSSSPVRVDGVKASFNIGASSPKEDTRLSPKTSRKDRSKVLRSKRERAVSPVPRDRSSTGTRSRSGSIQGPREPVKEAMSPSVAQCLRAVFAAFMWHEGIVHDAMACASFLKFHPNLPKVMPKIKVREERMSGTSSWLTTPGSSRLGTPGSTPSGSLKKHSRQSSGSSLGSELSNANINEALKRMELGRRGSKDREKSKERDKSKESKSLERVKEKTEGIRKERANSESETSRKAIEQDKTLDVFERKDRSFSDAKADTMSIESGSLDRESKASSSNDEDLPPTLQHLVSFWEELSASTQRVINQNLILPGPALSAKSKSRNDKKDRDKNDKSEKKSKKKKDMKYANASRGNLFGEAAAGMLREGGDREALCELCGGMFSHPVTYHMKQMHPGCGKHAAGQGYNSGGNFCGGWAGNCGDGGVGGSTWYLMCERCREKHMRDRRQANKQKDKKVKKKSTPVKQPPPLQPLDPHLLMKNNAMFLLDLASSSGINLPNRPTTTSSGGKSTATTSGAVMRSADGTLPSVSEDNGHSEHSPFATVPFLFLQQRGAPEADTAFAEDLVFSERGEGGGAGGGRGSNRRHGLCKSGHFERHDGGMVQRSVSAVADVNYRHSHHEGSHSPGGSRSAEASPIDAEHGHGGKLLFQRSISEISAAAAAGDECLDIVEEAGNNRLLLYRKRNNSGNVNDGGMSLLRHPSAAMSKLISAGHSLGRMMSPPQRPVMFFVSQQHDLDSLKLAMKQGLRKAACRVYALQAFNWLLRSASQPTAVHDLLWFFVGSLSAPVQEDEIEELLENDSGKKELARKDEDKDLVCEHPLSDITIAGEAVYPLPLAFHTFLQSISDVMMYLPPGSSLQQMAVRCWCLNFRPLDHVFLHKSYVFSNISKILSKSDEGWGLNAGLMSQQEDKPHSQVTCLKDITGYMELKASSRQAMIASLTDNSTETFWESGDEDRNKTKSITITCPPPHHPHMVYVHIDNSRDISNKVSSVVFQCASSGEELRRLYHEELEARHIGWLACSIPDSAATTSIKIELKGPDNSLRLRQVKVLGETEGMSLMIGGGQKSYLEMQQKNCEAETLKVFRLLTSQVFGKLVCEGSLSNGSAGDDNKADMTPGAPPMDGSMEVQVDLKEHMVGILFSRSKLTHLQKQVCSHIVQAIRKETLRVRDEWEQNLQSGASKAASDAYCFELLSMVLALSGSEVGSGYLAQQHNLLQDLLSLLHTASPRVQRQVTLLLRRVLPSVPPQVLATLLGVASLPPADFSILTCGSQRGSGGAGEHPPSPPPAQLGQLGILDVFLACIAKALTVQTKSKANKASKAGSGASAFTIADCLTDGSDHIGSRWWLRGTMSSKLARSIISLLKDLASGKLSEEWASVTKSAVAEAILALTKLEEQYRQPADCVKTPTLWLALASLCVLDKEHVERLSSGQWVGSGEHNMPRPTCDNHDDGETPAIIHCVDCGNLCADCDRFLHLHRKMRSHQRQVFKEEEESIKVDLHEGCGRTKLFWVMALTDSKTLKSLVEFRDGAKKLGGGAAVTGTCRFCGSTAITGLTAAGNVCSDVDCQQHAENACSKNLTCGHRCHGINEEEACLPCLYGCNSKLSQDADDMCMICFTEALSAAPTIQISCGHMFHLHCCKNVLEKRWVGPRITFGFSLCPICKRDIKHTILKEELTPIRTLYEDVRRKALMRLEYEGLHKAEAITTVGARFHNDPCGYAMERYAYYVCFKCTKAYYGGEARCEDQAAGGNAVGGDAYDPAELVCGACSDVSRAQMCPKHGTDFLEYKCRYCCSVAVFFCFGTTHFCNACHDDFQRVTNITKTDLPHCPAELETTKLISGGDSSVRVDGGGRGCEVRADSTYTIPEHKTCKNCWHSKGPKCIQLEGEECPLHVQHPPTGEEFALGCGVCRNAHTF